jgi:sugar fermentation stimulation protein A
MIYGRIIVGNFVFRKNRFIATVLVEGREETVHVKNTGRCKELLIPGVKVYLSVSDNPLRKTKYDLVAVEKKQKNGDTLLINMDSAAPNEAVAEWLGISGLFPEGTVFKREVTKGNSRFDFSAEYEGKIAYIEVKGVTLEEEGQVFFPDAPTERGVKHLNELRTLCEQGIETYVIFVVQMQRVLSFSPNDKTHKQFGDSLRLAAKKGVKVIAVNCEVTAQSMKIIGRVRVDLQTKEE